MTTTLTPSRYLELVAADGALLRSAARRDLTAAVPSCPGWTVADLLAHVGEVYLHKAEAMRLGVPPDPWPPPEHADRAPLQRFDEGLESVLEELRARGPDQPAWTWSPRDQTTGFWFRRMAQETAVHRYDAELASGTPTPLDPELAVDGVDEILRVMFAGPWWANEPSEEAAGTRVRISTGERDWTVVTARTTVTVEADAADPVDALVSGEPSDVDLWLWGRLPDARVCLAGDAAVIAAFRRRFSGETE